MQQKTEPKRVRSLSFGIERLGLTALRYPLVAAALIIAVTIAAGFGYTRLKVDNSLSELFRTDTPEFHDYETISERFPSSEYDVLIVVSGDNLLERKSINALRNLIINLQFVDGMAGEVSLFSAREAPEPGKIPGPVFPAELPKGDAYKQLIDKVRNNEIIKGKLLSDDGTLTLILLALDRKVVEEKGLGSVVQQIHDTAAEELKDTGLKMQLSGAPGDAARDQERRRARPLQVQRARLPVRRDHRLRLLPARLADGHRRATPRHRHHLVARPVRLARLQAQSVLERHDPADHGARLLRLDAAHRRHAQPAGRRRPPHQIGALCRARRRPGLRARHRHGGGFLHRAALLRLGADPHFRHRRRAVDCDCLRRRHHACAAAHPHADPPQREGLCVPISRATTRR